MIDPRRQFGNDGENLAATFLESKGYKILERQYRCTFGEIDLVCQFGDEVVFVEVKSRHTHEYGWPEESVTATKRRHLLAVSEEYLETHHAMNQSWRVDVIAIEFDSNPPNIVHIEAIDV